MRRAVAIAALALLVLGGACGSDDDEGATDDTGADDIQAETTTAAGGAPVQLSGSVNDEGTDDASGDQTLALETVDNAFKPTFVKVTSGQALTVELRNAGQRPHTFTIDGAGVDQQVEPGASATVEVDLPDAEAVAFYCKFHRGGGMQGAFYVTEGASVGSPTATNGAPDGASGASGY